MFQRAGKVEVRITTDRKTDVRRLPVLESGGCVVVSEKLCPTIRISEHRQFTSQRTREGVGKFPAEFGGWYHRFWRRNILDAKTLTRSPIGSLTHTTSWDQNSPFQKLSGMARRIG
jgi:hypothetical protein